MAVETTTANAADEAQQAAAWNQVQPGDAAITPPPTGDALGHANDERARIRAMLAGDPRKIDVDPSKAFRDPNARAEQAAIRNPPDGEPGVQPPAEAPVPAPAPAREKPRSLEIPEGTDPDLEAKILGHGQVDENTRIFTAEEDKVLDIDGRKVSSTRLRDMEEAYLKRGELERKERELERKDQVMVAAVHDLKRDPLGSLAHIGVTPDVIAQQLRAKGLYAEPTANNPATNSVPELPAEHTPLEKALFDQNQALVKTVHGLKSEIDDVKTGIRSEAEQRREMGLRQARAAGITAASHELRGMASKMPSFVLAPGKLSPMAELLLQNVEMQLEARVNLGASPDEIRAGAVTLFREGALRSGIASKQERAQAALGGSKRASPVPRPGATVPIAEPGANGNGRRFNFEDDEQRMKAADDWFAAQAGS